MTFFARLVVVALAGAAVAEESPRERIPINDNWRFIKGDPTNLSVPLLYDVRPEVQARSDTRPADAEPRAADIVPATTQQVLKPWILPTANDFIEDPAERHARPSGAPRVDVPYVQRDFDDRSWRLLELPHDWAIEGPFDVSGAIVGGGMGRLPSPGVGWYRKKLHIPAADAGKSLFLDVDGAMSYAAVWLNGQLVGGWPYGYASWRLDLTPYVSFGGENQLVIRLDNPPDSSRWYPGAGIYRNVWLTKTSPIHVGHWGTFMTTTTVSGSSAGIHLRVAIDNDSQTNSAVTIATAILGLDATGKGVGPVVATIAPVTVPVPADGTAVTDGSAVVPHPRLWGPPPAQQPNRYVAVTTVSRDGQVLDRYETRFGIREVRFDPGQGILVNGERVFLRGVNLHHDLGALGAAFNTRAAERQLEILREMGCNAIRTAHNPPAPELLELADRMGFLVVDEIFDVWERKKTPLDFHLIFPDWHEPDLRAFVRRDRNHPSVILWSIGNEVGEQYTGGEGAAVARRLHAIVREEDRTRPTTVAMNYAKPDMPLPAVVDVISLNYQGEGIRDAPAYAGLQGIRTPPLYPAFHEAFPDKLILSSENAAALSSRGTYLFPVFDGISAPVRDGSGGDPNSQHVSAYELYTAPFGASADKVFRSLDRHPYVAGGFVWSGWDYLGEPTPYYGARSSYFGIVDLAGFQKDRFRLYQSRWRPDLPVAHILPHWTWPEREGRVTPVHVFTSGDEAELFLNGQSLGRKQKGPDEYRLRWEDVRYRPGTLEVVAYRNGNPWATAEVKTAGPAFRLNLERDRGRIHANGRDLAFVSVTVTDSSGATVPRADHRIRFTLEGPGEIVATDNGDPTSFEPFQSRSRDAFNGRCLVIVRGRAGQPGTLALTAEAEGLEQGTTSIETTLEPGRWPEPVELTAEEDHRLMMQRLGISSLRPGANPNDPNAPNAVNYDESKANPWPDLPDPLRMKNGSRVTTLEMWWRQRRPEIVEAFDREVYGRVPGNVPPVRWETVAITRTNLGAVPILTKQLLGRVDNSSYPLVSVDIELTLTTPGNASEPVPVIMEFGWGALGERWRRRPGGGGPDWQQQVLAKGWGYAILVPTSIQADNGAGLTRGIIGLCNRGRRREPEDWGALRAWAWGASRALDYFETDDAVDAGRVGIEGLSRYGKAALVAMAYDQRFAIGFIGSSGAGGAKLHRRTFGELVENLAGSGEYHWMAGNFLKYGGPLDAGDLPVDAHELIALCAPRPVFISYGASEGPGAEGMWVDQRGSFMAAVEAGPVYRLLGKRGLGTSEFPPPGTAWTEGELAWRQHRGGHTTGPNWPTFLDWADRYIGRSRQSSQ